MKNKTDAVISILQEIEEVNRLIAAFNDDMDNLMLDNYQQRKYVLTQELLDALEEWDISLVAVEK